MDKDRLKVLVEQELARRRESKKTSNNENKYVSSIKNQIKSDARFLADVGTGAIGGVADIAGLPTRAAGGIIGGAGYLSEKLGVMPEQARKAKDFGLGLATQESITEKLRRGIDTATGGFTSLPEGESGTKGKIVRAMAGAAAPAGILKAAGIAAKNLPKALQLLVPATKTDVLAAGTATAAVDKLQEAGFGAPVQIAGGLLAGGTAAAGSNLLGSVGRHTYRPNLPKDTNFVGRIYNPIAKTMSGDSYITDTPIAEQVLGRGKMGDYLTPLERAYKPIQSEYAKAIADETGLVNKAYVGGLAAKQELPKLSTLSTASIGKAVEDRVRKAYEIQKGKVSNALNAAEKEAQGSYVPTSDVKNKIVNGLKLELARANVNDEANIQKAIKLITRGIQGNRTHLFDILNVDKFASGLFGGSSSGAGAAIKKVLGEYFEYAKNQPILDKQGKAISNRILGKIERVTQRELFEDRPEIKNIINSIDLSGENIVNKLVGSGAQDAARGLKDVRKLDKTAADLLESGILRNIINDSDGNAQKLTESVNQLKTRNVTFWDALSPKTKALINDYTNAFSGKAGVNDAVNKVLDDMGQFVDKSDPQNLRKMMNSLNVLQSNAKNMNVDVSDRLDAFKQVIDARLQNKNIFEDPAGIGKLVKSEIVKPEEINNALFGDGTLKFAEDSASRIQAARSAAGKNSPYVEAAINKGIMQRILANGLKPSVTGDGEIFDANGVVSAIEELMTNSPSVFRTLDKNTQKAIIKLKDGFVKEQNANILLRYIKDFVIVVSGVASRFHRTSAINSLKNIAEEGNSVALQKIRELIDAPIVIKKPKSYLPVRLGAPTTGMQTLQNENSDDNVK